MEEDINSSSLERLWQLLKTELANYPGRVSLATRMALSCTLVMVIVMVFRIPGGALGAYLPLLMPRENEQSTWREVTATAVLCIAGTLAFLLGALLFAASPIAHFFWAMGSLFAVFYLTSTLTVPNAAVGLGLLAINGITIWERQLSANARVSLTLYTLLSVLIGCAVTLLVEICLTRTHPHDLALTGVQERLSVVSELLGSYARGEQPDSLLRHRLKLYARRDIGALRETLAHSAYAEPYRSQLDTALSLSHELIALGANLTDFPQQPSEEDCARLRTLGTLLEQTGVQLEHREAPGWVELPDTILLSQTLPSLGEIERNVELLVDVFSGEPPGALFPSPGKSGLRLFVDDAFQGTRHLRLATRGTLAAMLCYVAYLSAGWKGLDASVVTCYLTALSSTGMARQKQLLRFLGVFIGGCILGIGTQVFVLPQLDSLPEFALVFGANIFVCSWVATSGPRVAYAGLQMALAYELINLKGFAVNTSLIAARDSLLGIVLGLAAMWLIYDHLWATPSSAALRLLFIRNLRRIALLGQATTPHALNHERRVIDRAFQDLYSFADSLLFEPHVKDERDRVMAHRIREWHPFLRSVCLIQSGLLQQLVRDGASSSLAERVRAKATQTLNAIADRLEGKPAQGGHAERFADLLAAVEQVRHSAEGGPGLAREMRLNHALLIVVRDVDERAASSFG